jgi:RNA polymerase sigma-70 factor, ECF subfamily
MLAVETLSGNAIEDLEPPELVDDESALLTSLAAGDRMAAERLVERTYRMVFAFLKRVSGDAELAADLTQETYRKAWASLASFDGRARFGTWLCRIAYNTFLNHIRRPRRLLQLEEGQAESVRDLAPSREESLAAAVERERLRRAVLALPEELCFTVTALYWSGLSVREVAAQENVTTVAIRKRLKRALARLALELEEKGR